MLDIIYTISIAALFNILSFCTADHLYKDLDYNERMEKVLLVTFVIGLSSLLFNFLYFKNLEEYYNKNVSNGITLGSILLITYTIVGNWDIMQSEMKLVILAISFITVIWLAYRKKDSTDDLEEKNRKEYKVEKKLINNQKKMMVGNININPNVKYEKYRIK